MPASAGKAAASFAVSDSFGAMNVSVKSGVALGDEMKTLPVKRKYVGEDKSVDPRPRCANDDDVYLLDYHFTRLHSGRPLP